MMFRMTDEEEMEMRAREAEKVRASFVSGKAQRRRKRMIRKREKEERRRQERKEMIRDSMRQSRHTTPWVSLPRQIEQKMSLSSEAASAGFIVGVIRGSRKMSPTYNYMPRSLDKFHKRHKVAKQASILTKMNKDSEMYRKFTMPWKSPPDRSSVLLSTSYSSDEDWSFEEERREREENQRLALELMENERKRLIEEHHEEERVRRRENQQKVAEMRDHVQHEHIHRMRQAEVLTHMKRVHNIERAKRLIDDEQARRVHVWKSQDVFSNMQRRARQKRAREAASREQERRVTEDLQFVKEEPTKRARSQSSGLAHALGL